MRGVFAGILRAAEVREEVDRTCEKDCWDSCGSMSENATRTGSSAASLPPHACSGEVSVTGRTPLHL